MFVKKQDDRKIKKGEGKKICHGIVEERGAKRKHSSDGGVWKKKQEMMKYPMGGSKEVGNEIKFRKIRRVKSLKMTAECSIHCKCNELNFLFSPL